MARTLAARPPPLAAAWFAPQRRGRKPLNILTFQFFLKLQAELRHIK
jgi:hypothetical protein